MIPERNIDKAGKTVSEFMDVFACKTGWDMLVVFGGGVPIRGGKPYIYE
jgi:hypothetical protein